MKYNPYKYQQTAMIHLLTRPASVLMLDMGLGKTVITLTALEALLETHAARKILIIAPKRVAENTWPEEIKKWEHTQHLDFSLILGSASQRATALTSPAPIHIINRENIPWLVEALKNQPWPYETVIIDELSSFKNPSSKRSKALFKQRKHIRRIVGLTGTPISTSLMDLFGQYKLIDTSVFGTSITRFREAFFHPTKYVYGRPVDWQIREGMEAKIYEQIQPYTLSMQAEDYLTLPPITYRDYPVNLPPDIQGQYRQLKNDLILSLEKETITAANAATLSGTLLQFTSGAIYNTSLLPEEEVNKTWTVVHEAKLDALEDIVEAANGQPLLIGFWFKHEKQRIIERFPTARHLSSPKDFQDWNQGKISLALIHPASAGHGLNLQAGGHYLIWFSLPWSLELYKQTNARLYRQGQTRPVTVTHLVAAGTIDERVVKALQNKNVTQAALIEAVKTEIKKGNQQ